MEEIINLDIFSRNFPKLLKTPDEIFTDRKKMLPGSINIIDQRVLEPSDLEKLTVFTAELNYEIGLDFNARLQKFIYYIGDQYSVDPKGYFFNLYNLLKDDLLVDLHTHPKLSGLKPSRLDLKHFFGTNILCRHFIGKPRRNKMIFQEFDSQGGALNQSLNLQGMTDLINQIIVMKLHG